jgi:hypothetical protein
MKDEKAIYLFKDRLEAEDAASGWLGDRFNEDEDLVLLTINPIGLKVFPSDVGYEIKSYDTIPFSSVLKIENL